MTKQKYISDWTKHPGKYDIYGILVSCAFLVLFVSPFFRSALWTDEIFSVISSRNLAEMLGMFRKDENNMALYYLLLNGWTNIFGESEIAARSLSLLFTVLTIPVLHILVLRCYGRRTAFMADLLLVSNPIFLYYSIEARGYSMLMFLGCLSTLVLFYFYNKPRTVFIVLYAFLIAASMYVHYFGVFIPLCHAIFLSFNGWIRGNFKLFLTTTVLVTVLVSPLFVFHPGSVQQISWIPEPELKYVLHVVSRLFGHKLVFIFVMITVIYFIWSNYRDMLRSVFREYALLSLSVIMIIVPVFIVYLVSIFYVPVLLLRYFAWSVPFAVIITAVMVDLFSPNRWMPVIFGLCLAFQISQSYKDISAKGSGYRESAAFIQQSAKPGDALLCYPFIKNSHVVFYSSRVDNSNNVLMPASIAKGHFYRGGGRRDPDVDLNAVKNIAMNNKRIFVVCRVDTKPTDKSQNRHWLPRITETIQQYHPLMKEKIFRPESDEPIMVLIFE